MEPLTVIGGIAASSQILTETVKSVDAAYKVCQSFHHAPRELEQVAQKLAWTRDRIQQIESFGCDLSGTDIETLFPLDHRILLSAALERSMDVFSRLRSLKDAADRESFRVKLSWAVLDKRKVGSIMRDLSETESILDQTLTIFNARLGTLNRTSLDALRVGQVAMQRTSLNIASSISNVQLVGNNTLSQIQENTALVQSNALLLQKSLDEQRASQQRVESMLASQMQLLQNMQDTRTSMALSHQIHNPCGSSSYLTQQQLGIAKAFTSQWVYGNHYPQTKDFSINSPRQPTNPLLANLQFQRKTKGKRTDLKARIDISILSSHILQVEIHIRVVATAWLSFPSVETKVSIANMRPEDAPIFQAIKDIDLSRVRSLIESGDASIHDMSAPWGETLLGCTLQEIDSRCWTATFSGVQSKAAQAMVAYLLRVGCDPNSMIYKHRRGLTSLLGLSIESSIPELSQLLFDHGADLDFPASSKGWVILSENQARAHLEMFRSWALPDWQAVGEGMKRRMLTEYHTLGQLDDIILLFENGDICLKDRVLFEPMLWNVVSSGDIEMTAISMAYGLDIGEVLERNNLLRIALSDGRRSLTSVGQLLLLHGVEGGYCNIRPDLWHFDRRCVLSARNAVVSLQQMVLYLAHALLHGSDCVLSMPECYWEDPVGPGSDYIGLDKWLIDTLPLIEEAMAASPFNEHEHRLGAQREIDNQVRPLNLISTGEGFERFRAHPVVAVYWVSLVLAGYHAEMGDEGEIWWSDDDCDRYVDARDKQPPYTEANDYMRDCSMCRDPKAWGLQDILDREQAGLKAIEDHRKRKVTKQEVNWPKTYGSSKSL